LRSNRPHICTVTPLQDRWQKTNFSSGQSKPSPFAFGIALLALGVIGIVLSVIPVSVRGVLYLYAVTAYTTATLPTLPASRPAPDFPEPFQP
jgi:hypothetical protein